MVQFLASQCTLRRTTSYILRESCIISVNIQRVGNKHLGCELTVIRFNPLIYLVRPIPDLTEGPMEHDGR